jgi:hypothetical protein
VQLVLLNTLLASNWLMELTFVECPKVLLVQPALGCNFVNWHNQAYMDDHPSKIRFALDWLWHTLVEHLDSSILDLDLD